MLDTPWILMPVLVPEHTETAISDCLAQSTPCRLLVINQGVTSTFRERLERIAEDSDRVFVWSHEPRLPSLAATWNHALDFAWASAEHALVVNNDVRLAPNTLEELQRVMTETDALFVSAVGVREKQFSPGQAMLPLDAFDRSARGGPDFSCFLIHRSCHARWRFDERFIPAYCEDLDYHRRLMLDGRGTRIFSVNVPYLHYAAGTLTHLDPKQAQSIKRRVETVSRAYYVEKWGGPVNHERFRVPFDETSAEDGLTTPELQEEVRRGQAQEPEPTR